MAIALHASSPALVTDEVDGTTPTAAFSPPAQSLLVAMAAAADEDGSLTISGGSLTWTRRAQRDIGGTFALEIWTAPCAAGATGITTTLTNNGFLGSFAAALKVDVFTGADLTTPTGATGQNLTSTNASNVNAYTATAIGSRGVAVAVELNSLGLPSSTDDESAFDLAQLDGMMIRKAANSASLATVTFNLDAAGSSTASWEWLAVEIMPGAEALVAGRGRMLGQAVNRAAFY
ncbi:hypothetical protein MF672_010915 [Actinomadura sp. ATCC 31491]|uniref:Uncharacterized protein n=1 Tax=Actinomadura luzonensis TaxID=2805427 RepID=A0ABT0FPL5_9ACTN|nr:hypothetical protein [Actinomadura luzonensis]MCK2214298.1 hypothetical protein [Actinomadura luzonensis]